MYFVILTRDTRYYGCTGGSIRQKVLGIFPLTEQGEQDARYLRLRFKNRQTQGYYDCRVNRFAS